MLHALKLVCFFFVLAEIKVTEFSSEEADGCVESLIYSMIMMQIAERNKCQGSRQE
jgi:hypothetical protein